MRTEIPAERPCETTRDVTSGVGATFRNCALYTVSGLPASFLSYGLERNKNSFGDTAFWKERTRAATASDESVCACVLCCDLLSYLVAPFNYAVITEQPGTDKLRDRLNRFALVKRSSTKFVGRVFAPRARPDRSHNCTTRENGRFSVQSLLYIAANAQAT